LKAGDAKTLPVSPGDHLLQATSADGLDAWQAPVTVGQSAQKLLQIPLSGIRQARLEKEQKQAAERMREEERKREEAPKTVEPPATPTPPGPQCKSAEDVISAIYQQVLERPPDPIGLRKWTGALTKGKKSVRTIVMEIGTSLEYRNRFVAGKTPDEAVRLMYSHFLARKPDPGGLAAHVIELPTVGATVEIRNAINSPEYDQRFGNGIVPSGSVYPTAYCR
jgi:hypothetical protein